MDHTFTDAKGREWRVPVPKYGTVCQIRSRYDLDIGWLATNDGVSRFHEAIQNPMTLVPALYDLCRQGGVQHDIAPEEFGESVCGDAYQGAYEAFQGAVVEFFPTSRRVVLMAAIGVPDREIQNQIATWTKQSGGLPAVLDSILPTGLGVS